MVGDIINVKFMITRSSITHQVPGLRIIEVRSEVCTCAFHDLVASEAKRSDAADVQHHHRHGIHQGQATHDVEEEVGLSNARGAYNTEIIVSLWGLIQTGG